MDESGESDLESFLGKDCLLIQPGLSTEKNIDVMYIYSKQINESHISGSKISRRSDTEKISRVVESLKSIGKINNLDYFDLKINCKKWILTILEGFSDSLETQLEYLLNDFTDSMKTRMREEDINVISIISDDYLLICHSRSKENTITPAWKVVKRMLDKDNVDRFVFFLKEGDKIDVCYYEHYPSGSFINWLGIPEGDAFYYMGGKNRLYTNIIGLKCSIELSDEDVEHLLLSKEGKFKIEKHRLDLMQPLETLQIDQIRVGKKQYASMEDFLQSYLARRYNLTYYQQKYKELAESLQPLLARFIDDVDDVVQLEPDGEKIFIKKNNPNIHIIFASNIYSDYLIQMRESFFDQIFAEFLNKRPLRIFHAGMKLFSPPSGHLKFRTLEFFNELNVNELIITLIKFYNDLTLRDKLLDNALCYVIIGLLHRMNYNKPISLFLERFLKEFESTIMAHSNQKIIQNEANVIELKSSDFLASGDNKKICNKIFDDLSKKFLDNNFKVYLFGINESTLEIEPMSSNKFPSDRLGTLEQMISRKFGNNVEIALVKVPLNGKCLIQMIVKSKWSHND